MQESEKSQRFIDAELSVERNFLKKQNQDSLLVSTRPLELEFNSLEACIQQGVLERKLI